MDPEVTRQPPRAKKEPIITRKLISRILTSATCVLVIVLWIYSRYVVDGEVSVRGRTMTFTAFVVVDMWNSLGCRSESRSVFKLPRNIFYNYAVAFCLLGQLLVIYTPFLQSVFQTQALSVFDLLYITILGSAVWIADEVSKAVDTGFAFKRSRYLPVQDQLGRV